MIIDHPAPCHIPVLRSLWKEAFGDADSFLDDFFRVGFHPGRCRCVFEEARPVAMLYWFDCSYQGRKMAYLYAIATKAEWQGKGLCRNLMADTHRLLRQQGYGAALLVPGNAELFRFYAALGYKTCAGVQCRQVQASSMPLQLREVDWQTYASLRCRYLPKDALIQEGALMAFLEKYSRLFAGDGFVLSAVITDRKLIAQEFLGQEEAMPAIVGALGLETGFFRFPGAQRPFAMGYPLDGESLPGYVGLALD